MVLFIKSILNLFLFKYYNEDRQNTLIEILFVLKFIVG